MEDVDMDKSGEYYQGRRFKDHQRPVNEIEKMAKAAAQAVMNNPKVTLVNRGELHENWTLSIMTDRGPSLVDFCPLTGVWVRHKSRAKGTGIPSLFAYFKIRKKDLSPDQVTE